MPIHENQKDRGRQQEALFLLQRHLTALGVTAVSFRETPQDATLPYDAQMFVHSMYTGIVEVKSISYRSDQVEEWGHLAISEQRMTALREAFMRRSAVTDKPYWNKEVILLVRCKDDVCFCIHIRRVAEVWLESEDAPEDFGKSNHGTEPSPEKYKFVKLIHWERFS